MSPGRPTPLGWVAFLSLASCAGSSLVGCAGGAPLLHAAHTLPPGVVGAGVGVVGNVPALDVEPAPNDKSVEILEDFAVAPGVGPWLAARVGLPADNELGLTYAGRSIRLDARHAFRVGDEIYLSLGAAGSGLIPRERGDDLGSVHGGGGDIPILLGWRSDAELYSVWGGPRAGFEILRGDIAGSELSETADPDTLIPFSGKDVWFGGLLGAKVGFRTFHVAIEVDVAYHLADGTFGELEGAIGQLTITPSGALVLTF